MFGSCVISSEFWHTAVWAKVDNIIYIYPDLKTLAIKAFIVNINQELRKRR